MKRQDSFYDVLGIDRASATTGVIDAGYKATFERISKELNDEPIKLELALQEINRAHRTLIDYRLKAEYDRELDIQAKKIDEFLRKQPSVKESADKVAERIINSANNAVKAHRASRVRKRFAFILIFVALFGAIFYFYYASNGNKSTSSASREPTKEQKKQTSSPRIKAQAPGNSLSK